MIRRTKRKKNIVIKLLVGILLICFIAAVIAISAYLMAVYKPSEYSPVPISIEKQEIAVDQAIALVAEIHNNIYAETEFVQTFDSKLINRLLLHEDLRSLLENEFSDSDISLEHPQVSLRDGLVIFYVTMDYTGHRVVLSVALEPYIDNDGMLIIELKSIRSGVLGIPMVTINDYLMQFAESIKEYTVSLEKHKDSDEEEFNEKIGYLIGQSLPELLKNKKISISPTITKPDNDDISVNLVAIEIENQKASLSFKQKSLK